LTTEKGKVRFIFVFFGKNEEDQYCDSIEFLDLKTGEYDKKDEERTEKAQNVKFTLVKLETEMHGISDAFFFSNQNEIFSSSIWIENKDDSFNLSDLSEQKDKDRPDKKSYLICNVKRKLRLFSFDYSFRGSKAMEFKFDLKYVENKD